MVVLLVGLVVSVFWVSDSAEHQPRQPVSFPPTTTALPTPSATRAVAPMPSPTVTHEPVPFDVSHAAQLTAETMKPPPPDPGRSLLHQLFPHLFPSG
ncbi:hypothetical protein A5724_17945 [Mycobacterium sp. ACS1612]|nr:hypothetical protein A5724_17945 [Mycobacterium sp. ACS1612]